MSGSRYRPRRRLRNEIFPLACAVSLVSALWMAFPRGAIGFRPEPAKSVRVSRNAIVSLSAERERRLLTAVRAAWLSESAGYRGVRANLLTSCCEDTGMSGVTAGLRPASRRSAEAFEEYECDLVPAGLAAPAPERLEPMTQSPAAPAFPKADLLKLN